MNNTITKATIEGMNLENGKLVPCNPGEEVPFNLVELPDNRSTVVLGWDGETFRQAITPHTSITLTVSIESEGRRASRELTFPAGTINEERTLLWEASGAVRDVVTSWARVGGM